MSIEELDDTHLSGQVAGLCGAGQFLGSDGGHQRRLRLRRQAAKARNGRADIVGRALSGDGLPLQAEDVSAVEADLSQHAEHLAKVRHPVARVDDVAEARGHGMRRVFYPHDHRLVGIEMARFSLESEIKFTHALLVVNPSEGQTIAGLLEIKGLAAHSLGRLRPPPTCLRARWRRNRS